MVAAAFVLSVAELPVALPVLPVSVVHDTPIVALNYDTGETIGWPAFVRQIAAVYRSQRSNKMSATHSPVPRAGAAAQWRLNDRIALVTGASTGRGARFARVLHQAGAHATPAASVINVASMYGLVASRQPMAAYNASKGSDWPPTYSMTMSPVGSPVWLSGCCTKL